MMDLESATPPPRTAANFSLYFEGQSQPELARTSFEHPSVGRVIQAARGATSLQGDVAGTFPWTTGVKALCILVLRTKTLALSDPNRAGFVMSGGKGSLARSLDFALSKTPNWLLDMLGTTSGGACVARRLIRRGNPEQKRPGPVLLTIHHTALPPNALGIYWDGKPVDSLPDLEKLARLLESGAGGAPIDPSSGDIRGALEPQTEPLVQSGGDRSVVDQSLTSGQHTTLTPTPNSASLASATRAERASTVLAQLPQSRHLHRLDDFLGEIRNVTPTIIVLEDGAGGLQLAGGIPSIFEHSSKHVQWLLESASKSHIGFITFPSRRSSAREAYEMFYRAAMRLAEAVRTEKLDILWATRFDSCLRGHSFPEMSAVENALSDSSLPPFDLQVYAPSLHQYGRVTVNGEQIARQAERYVPVAQTEYAKIPGFEYESSMVQDVIQAGLGNHDESRWFNLSCTALRTETIENLLEQLKNLPQSTRIVVDGVDESDTIVAAYLFHTLRRLGKRILFRAAPSLLLNMAGYRPAPATSSLEIPGWKPAGSEPGLIVAESLSELTRTQLQIIGGREDIVIIPVDLNRMKQSRLSEVSAVSNRCNKLLKSGFTPLLTTRLWEGSRSIYPSSEDRNLVLDSLANVVRMLEAPPAWILIKGGDACFSVVRWGIQASRLNSFGRFREGGTCSLVAENDSRWKGKPIILFPGNVGNEFSILRAIEALSGEG